MYMYRFFIDAANITGQMHIRGLFQYGGLNDIYLTKLPYFQKEIKKNVTDME